MPGRGYLPEVWLLGSSLFSATLAGRLGLPFSFAHHFSPGSTEPALAQYRASFRASAFLAEPRAMVAVGVLCAPSAEEADWLAGPSRLATLQLRTNRLGPLPTPEVAANYRYTSEERSLVDSVMATHLVGDPASVVEGLEALAARTQADELMLSTRVHGYEERARSFELVAARWAASAASTSAGVPGAQI